MYFCPRGAVRKSRYIAWSLSAIPWKTGSSKLLAAIALCRRSCRKARLNHDTIAPMLEEIRYHIDKLELIVDNQMWTLPKYRELLFIR